MPDGGPDATLSIFNRMFFSQYGVSRPSLVLMK